MERTPLPPHEPQTQAQSQPDAPPQHEAPDAQPHAAAPHLMRKKVGRRPNLPPPLRVYRVEPRQFKGLVQRLTAGPSPSPRPPQTSASIAPAYSNQGPLPMEPQNVSASNMVQNVPQEHILAYRHNIGTVPPNDRVPVGLTEEAAAPASSPAVATGSGGASDQLWSPTLYSGYNWEYFWNSSLQSATTNNDNNT